MSASNRQRPVESLEQVLREEVELYEKFASYLQRDQELMVKLQIEELEAANKAKDTLLLKIQALEQARRTYVRRLADSMNLNEEKVRLKDLIGRIPAAEGQRLESLRQRLMAATENLRKLQDATTSLANSSISWINGSMASLRRILTPNETYGPQGRVDVNSIFSGRNVEKRA